MAKYQNRVVASAASRGHYSDKLDMKAVDATRFILDRSWVCALRNGRIDQAISMVTFMRRIRRIDFGGKKRR
jgi:hypothetical protein